MSTFYNFVLCVTTKTVKAVPKTVKSEIMSQQYKTRDYNRYQFVFNGSRKPKEITMYYNHVDTTLALKAARTSWLIELIPLVHTSYQRKLYCNLFVNLR